MIDIYKSIRRELRTPRYWLRYRNIVDMYPKIYVESLVDTIDNLKKGISLSRFGDGEFRIMTQNGEAIGFQKHDEFLAERLIEVLNKPKLNHAVALPGPFSRSLFEMSSEARSFWIGALEEDGKTWKNKMEIPVWNNKHVLNTQVSRPYMDYPKTKKSRLVSRYIFDSFKMIWKNKIVLIVEGKGSNFGLHNDLLESAESIYRVLVPTKDAFLRYNSILEMTRNVINKLNIGGRELIVLLAIGPTATVLAYDLADAGVQILDIGHLDVEYQWYKIKAKSKIPLTDRVVNEANVGINDIKLDSYVDIQNQVLGIIK